MSSQAIKKDTTKKHIRALLLSSPVPLTVNELKRDFHNFIGEPIDYKGMGYTILEDFFRDISDAVTIIFKNEMMTLQAKADETTKHIERLVSKQKVTNKNKYAVYRNKRGGRDGQPRMWQGGNNNRYPPRRVAPNMVPPLPVVPPHVQRQMKDLFRSFPDGISVNHLDAAFSRVYGTSINYSYFGFQTQYDFLLSLKHILKVEESRTGECYIVPAGFTRQQQAPLAESARLQQIPVADSTNQTAQLQSAQSAEPISSMQTSPDRQHSSDNQSRPSKGRGRGRGRRNSGTDMAVGCDARSVSSNTSQDCDILEREVQQVLEKLPDGIWASSFPVEYTQMHGKALDYRTHGYMSVIDFMSAMDSVRIVRPTPQSDWLLFDARLPDPKAQEKDSGRARHCSGKAIEAETKEDIQKILANHPTGISVKSFPNIYREFTGHNLPVAELGFDSADHLFLSLADSALQFAYTGNEILMFSMDAELSEVGMEWQSEESSSSSEHIPEELADFPHDVVGPGCHYIPVMLPDVQQYVELYVTNVVHPGLFWVMLRHKTKSLALEALMDRIDEAYDKDSTRDPYTLPECLMVPGQVCVTLFPEDDNWHRGVITGRNEVGFVEVYYVDYGNTCFVEKRSLRFLKREFLKLPAQAVQSRLANTHPTGGSGGKWKVKCKNRLLELASHRPLVGYICDIKNQKMSLCLTDTSDEKVDVHINDLIISEGLAEFKPDAEVDISQEGTKHAMEPDYGHVFGWNTTEAPRLPKVAQGQSHNTSSRSQLSDSDESSTKPACYVKWVQVTDKHILHLINLDHIAYIVSTEISDLFWEDDILTSMLKKKRLDLNKKFVSSDEYPQLFDELMRYQVKSVSGGHGGKAQFLTLYRLDDLPEILRVFDHEHESLLPAVEELITKFDPESPYWKSGDGNQPEVKQEVTEVTEPAVDDDAQELQLSIEEKQMALQALQFKRKRILQSMMSNPSFLQEDVVNQLNACEVEILVIKQELQEQQSKASVPSDKSGQFSDAQSGKQSASDSDTCSENQRVIQNIIASATKPIAAANIMTKSSTSTTTSKPADVNLNFLSQSMAGSLPGMLGNNMAATENLAGMMGLQNMAYAQQQQQFFNPLLFGQTGLPQSGMGDLSNTMAGNFNMGAGLNPGLLPQLNPLLFQLQNTSTSNMTSVSNTNPFGSMSTFGRGQSFNPTSVGILPGLMPLLQNLSLGRGRGSGSGNNQ